MPVGAQTCLQLGLHFQPWGLLPVHEKIPRWSAVGIPAELTCLLVSLKILWTPFGAFIFAPLCGCSPTSSYRAWSLCF